MLEGGVTANTASVLWTCVEVLETQVNSWMACITAFPMLTSYAWKSSESMLMHGMYCQPINVASIAGEHFRLCKKGLPEKFIDLQKLTIRQHSCLQFICKEDSLQNSNHCICVLSQILTAPACQWLFFSVHSSWRWKLILVLSWLTTATVN